MFAAGSYDATVRLWDLRCVSATSYCRQPPTEFFNRSQNRQPIQVLEEARDAVQALHITHGTIMTGSVDGYVRTYDLRMGQLRTDFIGREWVLLHTNRQCS